MVFFVLFRIFKNTHIDGGGLDRRERMRNIMKKNFLNEQSIDVEQLNNILREVTEGGTIGTVDFGAVEALMKRKEILKEHENEYKYSEAEDCWYWRNPDKVANPKRNKIRRKELCDIEKVVVEHYLQLEKETLQKALKDNMTFGELFYEFLGDKAMKCAGGTIKKNRNDFNRHILPHDWFVSKAFKQITKLDVDKLFSLIITENTLTEKAFGNTIGLVKQAFKYAIDADYIEKSPYRVNVNKQLLEVAGKREDANEVFQPQEQELITKEQERRLKRNPSNTANLALLLCFETGLRQGELLALRECDINFRKRTLTVSRQQVQSHEVNDVKSITMKGYKIVNRTKGQMSAKDKPRKVPLTSTAFEIIDRILETNEKYHERCEDYLFVKNGRIMSPSTINSQIVRSCEYVGIPVRRTHKIRKTYASTLYRNGVDIMRISELLGHKEIKTTYENYIFELEDDEVIFADVIRALDATRNDRTKQDQKIVSITEMKKRKTS